MHVLELRLDGITQHTARQLSEGHLTDLLVEHCGRCDEHTPGGEIELSLVHQQHQLHHDGLGVCSVALIEAHHHTADSSQLCEQEHAIIDSECNVEVNHLVRTILYQLDFLSFIYEWTRLNNNNDNNSNHPPLHVSSNTIERGEEIYRPVHS